MTEDIKKAESTQAQNNNAPAQAGAESAEDAQKTQEAKLKDKYGKVYRVGVTVPVDDSEEKEFSYYFKRPSVPSYDRYIKSAAQAGITKASKVFMLDSVVDEDKSRLTADMEEYPGVAITIGNKLTEILGLTNTANLKKL